MRAYQNGYEYECEYPDYALQGGPLHNHGPPVYQQPPPASNPFRQVAVQPATVALKRNSQKKQKGAMMPLVPVTTTQVPTTSAPSQNTQQRAPPGKKWVLMEDASPANTPPATIQTPTPETSKLVPQVADITENLKAAQAAVN